MAVQITCPNCQIRLAVSEEHAGKLLCCGKCRQQFQMAVPVPPSPTPTGQPVGAGQTANARQAPAEPPAPARPPAPTLTPPAPPLAALCATLPNPGQRPELIPSRLEPPTVKPTVARSKWNAGLITLVVGCVLGAAGVGVGIMYFAGVFSSSEDDNRPDGQNAGLNNGGNDDRNNGNGDARPNNGNRNDDKPTLDKFPLFKPPLDKPANNPDVPTPPRVVDDIKPAPLKSDRSEVKLPSTISDLCVGGGGRFLILHLPQQRKLAVFDVNEAKVVKYLPVADDKICFAAGASKLIVVNCGNNIVQRWDLATLEREATAPLPFDGIVKTVAMGSASQGPLLVYYGKGGGALDSAPVSFINISTMKEEHFDGQGNGRGGNVFRDMMHYRASADGRTFGVWATSHTPSGLGAIRIRGRTAHSHYDHTSVGHIVPGVDGNTLYTGAGIYTGEIKPLGDAGEGRGAFCLPAAHGNFYMQIKSAGNDPIRDFRQPRDNAGPVSLTFHLAGQARPLVQLDDVQLGGAGEQWVNHDFTRDKRLHFIPASKLLVAIPGTNDRLSLFRFDVIEAMEKSGVDFLVVTSQPPKHFTPGKTLTYQMAVQSKKGGVKYKLESGPAKMSVSTAGKLVWPVDANFGELQADVVVTVSDAAGQEIFHNLRLVRSDGGDVADIKPPVKIDFDPPPRFDFPKIDPPPKDPKPEPVRGVALVRNAAQTLPITPPDLPKGKAQVKFPGTAADLCVGGGGRFLIFHIPSQRQLAILDLNACKIVKYLPLAEDKVLFAAGMTKLLVVFPEKSLVQRYDLTTFEREVTAPLPIRGTVQRMAMGHASEGALMMGYNDSGGFGGGIAWLDIQTMKEIAADGRALNGMVGFRRDYAPNVRASANNLVYGLWNTGLSPSGLQTLQVTGNTVKGHYEHTSVGAILPGPDGKTIFTGGGLYTPEAKPIGDRSSALGMAVPALHGDSYLVIAGGNRFTGNGNEKGKITVHLAGDKRPLATLTGLEGMETPDQPFAPREGIPADKRVLLAPLAKTLVLVSSTGDSLWLHRFDLDESLEKSGIDYLLATSQPITGAVRGASYEYEPTIKSKKGGVKLKLESGPDGMKVVDGRKLVWAVPKNYAESTVDVVLTVADSAGQEIFHNFRITVRD